MWRVGCCNCLLAWNVLAGLCASSQTLNDSRTIPNGDNWFDHPDILCTALQTLGYHAGSWGQIRGSWILWGILRDGQPARFQNRLGNRAVKYWGGFRNLLGEPVRGCRTSLTRWLAARRATAAADFVPGRVASDRFRVPVGGCPEGCAATLLSACSQQQCQTTSESSRRQSRETSSLRRTSGVRALCLSRQRIFHPGSLSGPGLVIRR